MWLFIVVWWSLLMNCYALTMVWYGTGTLQWCLVLWWCKDYRMGLFELMWMWLGPEAGSAVARSSVVHTEAIVHHSIDDLLNTSDHHQQPLTTLTTSTDHHRQSLTRFIHFFSVVSGNLTSLEIFQKYRLQRGNHIYSFPSDLPCLFLYDYTGPLIVGLTEHLLIVRRH